MVSECSGGWCVAFCLVFIFLIAEYLLSVSVGIEEYGGFGLASILLWD